MQDNLWDEERRLRRIINLVSVAVAILIAVVVPLNFIQREYWVFRDHAVVESQRIGRIVGGFAIDQGNSWRFQMKGIETLVLDEWAYDERWERIRLWQVRDANGNTILQLGQEPDWPRLVHVEPIVVFGRALATIEVRYDLSNLGLKSLAVAIGAFGAAALILLAGRHIPLRALRTTFGRLAKSEQELRLRIAELEQTRADLERHERELVASGQQLSEALDAAATANAAKSRFLASMSHELRTPLNVIIGFSDLINSQSLGPIGVQKYAEYAQDIHDSGQLLLSLINDILDFAKIESGSLKLHEEIVDPSTIAADALRIIAPLAASAGVSLHNELPALPHLRADERRFKQVLLNLFSNAVKFTPAGGSVRIAGVGPDSDGNVLLTVSDTGIGIAANDIEKALAPFAQIDSGPTRRHAGTGLGLPIAKELMEMHDGKLQLTSVVNAGTTVTLTFPKSRVVEPVAT